MMKARVGRRTRPTAPAYPTPPHQREDGLILPLCILPGGSGNTFAYDLRVHTIEEGVEALVQVRAAGHPLRLGSRPPR